MFSVFKIKDAPKYFSKLAKVSWGLPMKEYAMNINVARLTITHAWTGVTNAFKALSN